MPAGRQGAGQRDEEDDKDAGRGQGDHWVFPRSKVLLRIFKSRLCNFQCMLVSTFMVSSTGDFS